MSFILLTSSGVEDSGVPPGPSTGPPAVIVWPPVTGREPLPPFPKATGAAQPGPPQASCYSMNGDYVKTPPGRIPAGPDRRWHRCNFSGVRVPNFTSGYNDQDRSLVMSWELPTWSSDDQQLVVDHYAGVCGYTHLPLSIPQAKNFGVSREKLIESAIRCKQAGMFVPMIAVSDGEPFSVAIPWLEAMLDAGALVDGEDLVCGAWQVDKWYPEQDVVQLIIDAGTWAHAHGLLNTIHWGGGYGGWAESCACWNDITADQWGIHDRFSFQRKLADKLDGHYGQCNTEADIDAVQSWLLKALVAMPHPMFLVAMEIDAQAQYDEPKQRLELYGDLKGLLSTYADPNGRISYGNGARRQDGTVW